METPAVSCLVACGDVAPFPKLCAAAAVGAAVPVDSNVAFMIHAHAGMKSFHLRIAR